MNIAAPFIMRPIMTTTVMVAILLFGAMSYRRLPVSDLPNVDFPTIQVSAALPGASPETMASSVATLLEREFSTIAGIDSMNSASVQGNTQITIQFTLDRDIDAAAQDVQAAISRAVRHLPPDMPTPPSYQKVNPADQPILYLALTSPTLPLSTLNDYGETLIAQRISMVDGVAQVQVYGGQKYAVRIELNPEAMASRAIGIDEVIAAVQRENVNLPTGILYGPNRTFTVQANGQLMEAKAYRPLIVAYRNSSPVRLEELGRVIDSVENNKVAAWYYTPDKQQRAIVLAIQRQPGKNTIEVARAAKSLLATLKQQLPASVTMNMLYDRSEQIRASSRDVQFTLILTLVLVVLVIFLFLRNASATLIPSMALPMSVVGTFIVMATLNYSLDNLSLMALTLAVGFVVDDAIVVLENIVRHMEMGKPKLQATLDGTREIGFTIVSMTVSLAAVFIPVLFMGGIVGRLFREFAVTIGAAVLISGFISLTLTPMLASRFLRPPAEIHHGRIYIASERVYQAMLAFYDRTLRGVLRLLYIRSASGDLVPITAVARLKHSFGPLIINHSGQLPSVTISFNLKPDVSIGKAVETINALARRTLPPTISAGFQGTAQAFQSSMKGMGMLLILAIIVIYMVLAILYENFYHPITILSALPFAGVGALLTLMLFRCELSLYAFVGIIMLVGLVKKNGIMMIDFALETQRRKTTSAVDAIHEACLIRFRPIMMTTMAALMAGLPIAFGFGAGAEARRPLGLAVVGGLLFSQTLTLYVTPVFFVYMEKLRAWIHVRGDRHNPPGGPDAVELIPGRTR